MDYQKLMYSRSYTRDYRWLVVPDNLSKEELKRVKTVLDSLLDYHQSAFKNNSTTPLLLFEREETILLLCARKTSLTDQYSRPIFSLEGISVNVSFRRHLWFALPWILRDHSQILNVWREISFELADQKEEVKLGSFEFSLDNLHPSHISRGDLARSYGTPRSLLEVPYNSDGYESLIQLLSSDSVPYMNFVFGCTPSISELVGSIQIVGWITSQRGRPTSPEYRQRREERPLRTEVYETKLNVGPSTSKDVGGKTATATSYEEAKRQLERKKAVGNATSPLLLRILSGLLRPARHENSNTEEKASSQIQKERNSGDQS